MVSTKRMPPLRQSRLPDSLYESALSGGIYGGHLDSESGDVEKISEIIEECKNMKIPVLPPHINESFGGFTCLSENRIEYRSGKQSKKIRFGFYTIKNLGTDISMPL